MQNKKSPWKSSQMWINFIMVLLLFIPGAEAFIAANPWVAVAVTTGVNTFGGSSLLGPPLLGNRAIMQAIVSSALSAVTEGLKLANTGKAQNTSTKGEIELEILAEEEKRYESDDAKSKGSINSSKLSSTPENTKYDERKALLEVAWLLSVFVFALSVLVFVSACSQKYQRHDLVDQILKPRPGYEGRLTNSACLEYSFFGKCNQFEIAEYSLKDPKIRETLNTLDFICNIGGRRFKVCKDKPGFCRISYKGRGWFKKDKRLEAFYPLSDYQFLLDAKAKCFNKERYPFGGI